MTTWYILHSIQDHTLPNLELFIGWKKADEMKSTDTKQSNWMSRMCVVFFNSLIKHTKKYV